MDLLKMRRSLDSGRTIFDLPLRVVYYARVSTDKDEQLNSLENQVSYYDDFIKSNDVWTFSGGYVDEGLSGTSVDKRDDFLRMIKDGGEGRFDLVITKEISRFARDTLDSIHYTRKLLDCGVGVFFQSDNINTLHSDAELRLTIMASLAQDEMRRLSERVKFGMKRAYDNGKVLGQSNIYGYDKAKGKLVINEKQAEFVRELFSLYAEDKYGFRTIVRIMNERGYRNQDGKELNPGSISGILSNPKYKGYYHGRITESNDYRRKKSVKLAEEDRLLYKDDSIPAIVSEELWDRVNDILRKRSKKFHNDGNGSVARFAYSGKIVCEEHGAYHYRKMWRDRKVPAESWCCKEYLAKGRVACPTPHLYTTDLDAILTHIGKDLMENREKYLKGIDALLELYKKSERGNVDFLLEINKHYKEIDRAKSKQEKLLEIHLDGDMDRASYVDMNTRFKTEIERLGVKLAALEDEQQKASDTSSTLQQARILFNNLLDSGIGALEIAKELLGSVTILRGSTKKEMKLRINMQHGSIIPATILKPITLYGKTEVSPIVGTERQSEDLVHYLLSEFDDEPEKIWQSNIFGKSLHDLVSEGLSGKLKKMPEDARAKFQETLQRIINEGSGGLICIIL
ncbi:MAG: recombinase family protein [Oscillospiraceae bacterium]|nr:recombinase family protein [Oscillospiraceae bacterium]